MTSIDAIINRQLLKWEHQRRQAEEEKEEKPKPAPIITISRETGSRGSYFGSRLAMKLGYLSTVSANLPVTANRLSNRLTIVLGVTWR